jgi:hypothetical protein
VVQGGSVFVSVGLGDELGDSVVDGRPEPLGGGVDGGGGVLFGSQVGAGLTYL